MVYFSAAAHLSWPRAVYCPQAQVRRVQTRPSLLRERQKPHSQCRLTNRAATKGSGLKIPLQKRTNVVSVDKFEGRFAERIVATGKHDGFMIDTVLPDLGDDVPG